MKQQKLPYEKWTAEQKAAHWKALQICKKMKEARNA
jgi:hypothetical protein